MLCYHDGATKLRKRMANSNPRKQAAFAGKALSITGKRPLKRPLKPSCLIRTLKTSLTPLGYIPSGAVCRRDFNVSGAIPTIQFNTPAMPPANRTRGALSSFLDFPSGVSDLSIHS